MANPYHDENGRFCSKSEMADAYMRVYNSGDFEAAKTLSQQFKDIETQHAAEKTLKNLSEEEIQQRQSDVTKLLATQDYYDSPLTEQAENNLNNLTDEEVSQVHAALTLKEIEQRENELYPSQAKQEALDEKLFNETGKRSVHELQRETDMHKELLEIDAVQKIETFKHTLIKSGVPEGYAAYYIKKIGPRLGVSPTHEDNYGTVTLRNGTYQPFNKSVLTVRGIAKDKKAMIDKGVKTYLENNQEAIALHQRQIDAINANEEILHVRRREEGELRHAYTRAAADKLSRTKEKLEKYQTYRSQLRAAGVKTLTPTTSALSSLNPQQINTDSTGRVNNVWVVSQTASGNREVTPISSIQENSEGWSHLVDTSGKQYSAEIRYANYREEKQDFQLIVDETYNTNRPYSTGRFNNIVDSGD